MLLGGVCRLGCMGLRVPNVQLRQQYNAFPCHPTHEPLVAFWTRMPYRHFQAPLFRLPSSIASNHGRVEDRVQWSSHLDRVLVCRPRSCAVTGVWVVWSVESMSVTSPVAYARGLTTRSGFVRRKCHVTQRQCLHRCRMCSNGFPHRVKGPDELEERIRAKGVDPKGPGIEG